MSEIDANGDPWDPYDWDVETTLRRNGPDLTAVLLHQARGDLREERARAERESAERLATLSEAEWIGLRVMSLAKKGRKSIKVQEVTP